MSNGDGEPGAARTSERGAYATIVDDTGLITHVTVRGRNLPVQEIHRRTFNLLPPDLQFKVRSANAIYTYSRLGLRLERALQSLVPGLINIDWDSVLRDGRDVRLDASVIKEVEERYPSSQEEIFSALEDLQEIRRLITLRPTNIEDEDWSDDSIEVVTKDLNRTIEEMESLNSARALVPMGSAGGISDRAALERVAGSEIEEGGLKQEDIERRHLELKEAMERMIERSTGKTYPGDFLEAKRQMRLFLNTRSDLSELAHDYYFAEGVEERLAPYVLDRNRFNEVDLDALHDPYDAAARSIETLNNSAIPQPEQPLVLLRQNLLSAISTVSNSVNELRSNGYEFVIDESDEAFINTARGRSDELRRASSKGWSQSEVENINEQVTGVIERLTELGAKYKRLLDERPSREQVMQAAMADIARQNEAAASTKGGADATSSAASSLAALSNRRRPATPRPDMAAPARSEPAASTPVAVSLASLGVRGPQAEVLNPNPIPTAPKPRGGFVDPLKAASVKLGGWFEKREAAQRARRGPGPREYLGQERSGRQRQFMEAGTTVMAENPVFETLLRQRSWSDDDIRRFTEALGARHLQEKTWLLNEIEGGAVLKIGRKRKEILNRGMRIIRAHLKAQERIEKGRAKMSEGEVAALDEAVQNNMLNPDDARDYAAMRAGWFGGVRFTPFRHMLHRRVARILAPVWEGEQNSLHRRKSHGGESAQQSQASDRIEIDRTQLTRIEQSIIERLIGEGTVSRTAAAAYISGNDSRDEHKAGFEAIDDAILRFRSINKIR